MRRALAIDEASFGPDHPDVATDLNNLATLLEDQGHWSAAVALRARAKPIMTGAHGERTGARRPWQGGSCAKYRQLEGLCAGALSCRCKRCRQPRRGLRACAMGAAKRGGRCALFHGSALCQRGSRSLPSSCASSRICWRAASAHIAASMRRQARRTPRLRKPPALPSRRSRRSSRRSKRNCAKTFPIMPSWPIRSRSRSPTRKRCSAKAKPSCCFSIFGNMGKVPEETIVFALTKNEARWVSLPLGTRALRKRVTASALRSRPHQLARGKKEPGSLQGLAWTRKLPEDRAAALSMPLPRMRCIAICSAASKTSSRTSRCSSCRRAR